MKQNLDTTDRVLRFLLGFWWLGPWAPLFQWNLLNWTVFVLGWIALIESFLGWCWIHNLLHLNHKK